jgi:oxygen-independent coproporphyrinogen-3 oxidase
MKGIEAGKPVCEQIKDLNESDLLTDALIFGLRLNAGVKPAELAARFRAELPPGVSRLFSHLIEEGLMEADGDSFRLTGEGRMRADAVGVAVLDQFD